jgi:hypothetical protein
MIKRHRVDDGLLQRVRILLSHDRGMGNQLAHVFTDVVDRLVAMVDEIILSDRRYDSIAGVVPFGWKALAVTHFDEVIRRQDFSRHHEATQDGFVGLRPTGFDRHADRHRGTLALGIGESEAYVGPGLLPLALVFSQRAQTIVHDAPLGGASALSLVARHGVETLHVAISARQNHLSHIEYRGFAGPILPEHAGVSG